MALKKFNKANQERVEDFKKKYKNKRTTNQIKFHKTQCRSMREKLQKIKR